MFHNNYLLMILIFTNTQRHMIYHSTQLDIDLTIICRWIESHQKRNIKLWSRGIKWYLIKLICGQPVIHKTHLICLATVIKIHQSRTHMNCVELSMDLCEWPNMGMDHLFGPDWWSSLQLGPNGSTLGYLFTWVTWIIILYIIQKNIIIF